MDIHSIIKMKNTWKEKMKIQNDAQVNDYT